MQVRATKKCYVNHKLQRPGDVFSLREIEGIDAQGNPKVFSVEDQFSSKAMELVNPKDAEKFQKKKVSAKRPAVSMKEMADAKPMKAPHIPEEVI